MKKNLILTTTEKNNSKAKRVVLKRSENIEELRNFGKQFTRFNIVEIYNTKWQIVEVIV